MAIGANGGFDRGAMPHSGDHPLAPSFAVGVSAASAGEALIDAPTLETTINLDPLPVEPDISERAYPQVEPIDLTEEKVADERIPATSFYKRLSRVLAAFDAAVVVAAIVMVLPFAQATLPSPLVLLAVLSVASLGWMGVFHGHGMHTPRLLSGPEEFRKVLSASSMGALVTGFILAGALAISVQAVALLWAIALVLEMGGRRISRWWVAKLRQEGKLLFRTLIVGTNGEAGALAEALKVPALGYKPIGFVTTVDRPVSPDGLGVLGHIRHLSDLLWQHDIECIFVASSAVASKDMLKVTQAARQGGADVRISANVPDLFFSRLAVQSMGDLTSLALRPVHLSGGRALVKRVVDFLVGSIALILSLPLWAAIAVAIRRESPGPVLFRQQRVTRNGQVFTMLKFRTMVESADEIAEEEALDPSQPFFKPEDDPRLTSVGRFLRRFSLDELPQIINVLRGEMSIVGPRPLPAEQVAANLELLAPRHEVRAGMTGWWQTNGRSQVGPEDSVRLDLFYIENWSLALDLYILLKTIGAVVSGRGAY